MASIPLVLSHLAIREREQKHTNQTDESHRPIQGSMQQSPNRKKDTHKMWLFSHLDLEAARPSPTTSTLELAALGRNVRLLLGG